MTCTFYSSAWWHMWLALLPQSKEVLESIPSFSVWSVQILWVHGLKHQVRSPVSALDQGSGVGRCMMSGMGQMQRANFIILLGKYKVLQETFTWYKFSTAHNSDNKRWWDIFKTGLTILFFFSLEGLYCILMVSHVLKENIYCITLYC